MRGKILFATGLAVGYVLGTRAGRERYEQMKRTAQAFWNDPRVQRRVDQVDDFVSDGAKKLVGQLTGSGRSTTAPTPQPASGARSARSSTAAKTAAKRSTPRRPAAGAAPSTGGASS